MKGEIKIIIEMCSNHRNFCGLSTERHLLHI